MLSEQALTLEEEQYGRIIYNGRLSDYDTGQWYYQLHIVNLINLTTDKTPLDIFNKKPDKLYKQIAVLK